MENAPMIFTDTMKNDENAAKLDRICNEKEE
jgi:hypothetical protein